MPKHKKTLEEKKRADLRKQQSVSPFTYSLQDATPIVYHEKKYEASFDSHFMKHDLIKTLFVSSTIVILQLALFLLLVNHMILPLGIYK